MGSRIGVAVKRRCDLAVGPSGGLFRARREARMVETEGVRWQIACVRAGLEFRVADDLAAAGFHTYAPHAVRVSLRARVRGSEKRVRFERDYPVFAGYVFVGSPAGLLLARLSHDAIGAILDGSQPALVASVRAINAAHLAGVWDDRAKATGPHPFRVGSQVRFRDGAFAGLRAIVAALPAPMRLTLEVTMFGHAQKIDARAGQVESVAL